MPMYLFELNGEIREIFFKMNDEKRYIDENGAEWTRIYTKPQMGIDTHYDVNNSKDFVRYTANKQGTFGDLFDASKEWSEKRKGNSNEDAIQEKYYENFSKTRKGLEHPDVKKRKLKEKIKKSKMFDWAGD